MKASTYHFTNNFTFSTPTKEKRNVFDNNNPTPSLIDDNTFLIDTDHQSCASFDSTSYHPPSDDDNDKNFSFEDDNPSTSSPRSSSSIEYNNNHSYESEELR